VLLTGIDDPVPRVSAHCCGAITNFFEGAGDTIAASYANDFISKLTPLISNTNISLVIEHALTALAGLAHGCKA
jgi:hypothetical protein